jgi:hypothetical protein
MEHPFARRPTFNKTGQEIGVFVNQFRVMAAQTREIYQYDVRLTFSHVRRCRSDEFIGGCHARRRQHWRHSRGPLV